jgi:hypothetical protein
MSAFREPDERLSAWLADIDARLSALDEALASADAERIDRQTQALQASLAASVSQVRQVLQPGADVSDALRQRLLLARARCMQQQQAVHRATSSFGRTLGVLFPDAPGVGASVPAQTVAARALQAYR